MNTTAAVAWTPDARSARVAAIIQGIKTRIQLLTESYHMEQYVYAAKHIRYSEAKRHPTYAPATGFCSLEWWESYVLQSHMRLQELIHDMGVLERKWKDRALTEKERVAKAVGRIERAGRKRERERDKGAGERAGKRRAGHGGAVQAGVEVEGAD